MTLDRLRPVVDRVLVPAARIADRIGLTPNSVSVIALLVAVIAAVGFYLGPAQPAWYIVGAVLVGVNGWLDLLDGALARRQDVSSRAGDLLDHVLDRYADIIIIAGLAAGVEQFALGFLAITGVLLTSYLGTQTEAVGLDRTYAGLLGRADRLALVGVTAVLVVLVPTPIAGLTLIGWVLVVFGVVGHLTALQRFTQAWQQLHNGS